MQCDEGVGERYRSVHPLSPHPAHKVGLESSSRISPRTSSGGVDSNVDGSDGEGNELVSAEFIVFAQLILKFFSSK